jgi:hypothetical protein
VVSVLGRFLGPPEWSPTGSTVTILTPFITFAALGSFASLLLVGIVIRRTHSLPGWWAAVPVVVAVTAVPLILLSPVLQMINERLFNVPTLLIGCEWIALGAAMASRRGASKVTTLLDRSQMAWGDEDVRGVGGAAIRGKRRAQKRDADTPFLLKRNIRANRHLMLSALQPKLREKINPVISREADRTFELGAEIVRANAYLSRLDTQDDRTSVRR